MFFIVIPAKAGIHSVNKMDSRFRGNDTTHPFIEKILFFSIIKNFYTPKSAQRVSLRYKIRLAYTLFFNAVALPLFSFIVDKFIVMMLNR